MPRYSNIVLSKNILLDKTHKNVLNLRKWCDA